MVEPNIIAPPTGGFEKAIMEPITLPVNYIVSKVLMAFSGVENLSATKSMTGSDTSISLCTVTSAAFAITFPFGSMGPLVGGVVLCAVLLLGDEGFRLGILVLYPSTC